MGTKIYSTLTDRFVVGKGKIKKIFVYETLLKINGQDRTECFDDNFPCKNNYCDKQYVDNWLRI